jgi:hypothetical protein
MLHIQREKVYLKINPIEDTDNLSPRIPPIYALYLIGPSSVIGQVLNHWPWPKEGNLTIRLS